MTEEEEEKKGDKNDQQSEESMDHDIDMILNQSIDSRGDFLTDQPTTNYENGKNILFLSELSKPEQMPYDSYESSIKFLHEGFCAIKYNFSDEIKKVVTVRLSQDGKFLEYQDEKLSKVKSWFMPKAGIPVRDIIDFIYGGLSSTFKRHQTKNYAKL